jgi:hypothetical protein
MVSDGVLLSMLPVLSGMLLTNLLGMLLGLDGVLPFSVTVTSLAVPKNAASAVFTPAEYIVPFFDIKPFCSQNAIKACSTSGAR